MATVLEENAPIGKRIRFYRARRHPNSRSLAEAVGLSKYAILDYENGMSEPSLEVLDRIAGFGY
ncbi:MAG: helix-turn-helix domain-containing protein [Defluviitaleaceae bacterium]|nr:helix-turn-helix domain-containing protein [Defluviitaleaceae bacterium]